MLKHKALTLTRRLLNLVNLRLEWLHNDEPKNELINIESLNIV